MIGEILEAKPARRTVMLSALRGVALEGDAEALFLAMISLPSNFNYHDLFLALPYDKKYLISSAIDSANRAALNAVVKRMRVAKDTENINVFKGIIGE